ncbi:Tchp [Columba guinea]|nr:Tchp [Columba guinea]
MTTGGGRWERAMALRWAARGRAPERWAAERRRELEARNRQQWERVSRSFAQAAICCSRQARWSAPRALPPSSAAVRREAEEAALRLEERRERLRRLLAEEREALAAELRERRRSRGDELAGMRRRNEELRAGREERRRKVAEQLLDEHQKKTYAELREVEPELHRKQVLEAWGDQLMQKPEATKLKKEQDNLLKQRWELENLEEERKQMEEHRKKKELGRFLRHQCDAQLRRRAQQIQEELETDRQILLAILEKEGEDQRRESARREQAVADVAWMKRVIEEQLQLEKEREAELQMIFREEAKKVWEKREEEWEREKKARDRLMSEVLAVRQRQIQEKMELNRRAQEESIKYREQLIKELEEAKELTRREKVREEELKAARRQELEAQLTERCSHQQEQQQRQREEEEEESLVQQEAECVVEQGRPSRVALQLPKSSMDLRNKQEMQLQTTKRKLGRTTELLQ